MSATSAAVVVDGLRLAKLCKDIVPGVADDALLARLREAYAGFDVRLARLGQEWYRLGGVIDRQGNRVAHDLLEWSERAFVECGQNLDTLIQHCREQRLIATRHQGLTLYVTVRTGNRAEDFVQIEVDRSQELADRYVVDPVNTPGDIEELVDPLAPTMVAPYAVAPPRYIYRRKTDVALFLAELAQHRAVAHPAQRFADDWNRCSAGQSGKAFCAYWTLRLYQHKGRHGESLMNVEVVATRNTGPADLTDIAGSKGKALASLLNRFDANVGYPFAWFFHMVKGSGVSPHVGEAVFQDLSRDYAYLSSKDASVLADWVVVPYFS